MLQRLIRGWGNADGIGRVGNVERKSLSLCERYELTLLIAGEKARDERDGFNMTA